MDKVLRLLDRWLSDPSIGENISAWHELPARLARMEQLPEDLHPHLRSALNKTSIKGLYSHQELAWKYAKNGKHVVVVTGTASGKTLCYNLPVLDNLLRDPNARALYLFPTKALAQDQATGLLRLLIDAVELHYEHIPIVSIYDGDTPSSARSLIRQNSRLVISNPDMLHTGILPHHTLWADYFRNLGYVIIDEMHVYRGVFGSHVANVFRRLQRIARFYGSMPQFILTSATVANPVELAESLIEAQVQAVTEDGAGRGPKRFLIFNPPVINRELGLRRSALQESVRLAEELLAYDIQSIIFGRSRRTVELVLIYLRERTGASKHSWREAQANSAIRGYRSGYLKPQRRAIESGLRKGTVRAVVATNALELGIDIGSMGAALLIGYPGTVAATWQQAGRAGRQDETALAVLVATADPLDQFLAHHPDYLFQRSPEQALINPNNLLILLDHIRCAAFELPFQSDDNFGMVPASMLTELLDFLREQGILHFSHERYYWMADRYPAQDVSLRSASVENIILQRASSEAPEVIGAIDLVSAHWMVHPGAIYLHEGQSYAVSSLDLENKIAHLEHSNSDYYTEPRLEINVQLQEIITRQQVQGCTKAYGELNVISQLVGFRKVKWYTQEQVGYGEIMLPPTELQTTGYWLSLDESTVESLRQQGLWRNRTNNYGKNWSTQRDLARARDQYTCQVCGTPEQGRSHDVHHKIPFRAFIDPTGKINITQANRLQNLLTLCQTCHHRAEIAVRVRSGLAGLAFVLRHLSPLFVMCDDRDLGVHSDPQSPLSAGQPTIILYDLVPAGIGLSQRLFELHDDLIARAYELVTACDCIDGCPSCVGPGGESGLGGRDETLAILAALKP